MYRTCTPRPNAKQSVLYRAWRNMRSRCRGNSTKAPDFYKGLVCAFPHFACFRCFALARGFNKVNRSPDRVVPALGYVPTNIRFVSPIENATATLIQNTPTHAIAQELAYMIDFTDVPF